MVARGAIDHAVSASLVRAGRRSQYASLVARPVVGAAERSRLVSTTPVRTVEARFDREILYEIDGGERTCTDRLDASVDPASRVVCVPGSPP